MIEPVRLRLPLPPSVNHYYGFSRRTGARYLTKKARQYRVDVALLTHNGPKLCDAQLAVLIDVYPKFTNPDLDNFLKGLLDALQHGGVYDNDKQIRDLRIRFRHPIVHGAVDVQLWEIAKCSQ